MGKSKADAALNEAFENYSKAIEKFCIVRLGEARDYANDCVQETYCVFYRKLLDGTEFENPRAFLYKTANNMVLKAKDDYYKNAARTKSLDEADNIPVYIEEKVEDMLENDEVDIDEDDIRDYYDRSRITRDLVSKLSDDLHNEWIEYYEDEEGDYCLDGELSDYI